MAYGFQNCCDGTEYFYVNGIPSSVSELETYYIDTTEGLDFCATYVELPELFYQPKTYNLVGMTAQTDCTECTTSNPCPDIIEDDIDSISSYITTTSNECAVITESFFEVTCSDPQPIIPTFSNPNGGRVYITVTGGVPPYLVYSANTTTLLTSSSNPGNILVLQNKPGGTYSFDVLDFTNNLLPISCTLPTAPTLLTVSCNKVDVSGVYGNTNGQILTPSVAGGSPPYTYWSGSTQITSFPITNLGAGTYTITVKDSGTGSNFQQQNTNCVISQPTQIIYPSSLCMSFEFCGTGFLINFLSAGTINGRAYYTPNAAGNTSLGITSGLQLSWDGTKWTTNTKTKTLSVSLAGGCNPSGTNVQFIGPSTQQPIGSWIPLSSSFYNNDGSGVTVINVTEGSCTSSSLSVTAVANNGTCSATPNGTITLTVNNSTGPYTVFIGGADNNGQLSKTGLNSGTYSWSVTDSTNRTASGTLTINAPISANINLNVSASFNTSNDFWQDLTGTLTRTKLIGRRYDVTINASGLNSGEQIQGYFVVIYKQLALYKTTNIVLPDYAYTSSIYQPNVTWSLVTNSGSQSGYRWKKNGVNISNDYSDEIVQNMVGNRKCAPTTLCPLIPVLSSVMTSSANNACPTTATQAGVAALYYTVGNASNPITIDNNTIITGNLPTSFRWRPNASGYATFEAQTSCPRAYAEDWEIYFQQVGNIPQCKTLTFNNLTYNPSNPSITKYRRSFAVVDNQAGTQNTVAIVYGNGTPWSSITPDSTQRVQNYY
jgi:hypothetical protein